MSSKQFLLEECSNVKALLENTLRHDYGIESSQPFFDECSARLDFLRNEIGDTVATDVSMLRTLGGYLSDLAGLICRIERSSLGEYSWPFVEEFKNIASAICLESTIEGDDIAPQIYTFAEGGLSSYAIYTEHIRPSFCKKRLLTIVFPKALKNFVLLHTILGHELGHAIWQVSRHQRRLKDTVIDPHLHRENGPLQNPLATAEWLYSDNAPAEFKAYLMAQFPRLDQSTIFKHVNWPAWVEEILCDLIGLVIFGPGFVAAHSRLLYTVDPSGLSLGPSHPPVAWRVNMVLAGAKLLEYNKFPCLCGPARVQLNQFWQYLDGFKRPEPWFDFLSGDPLLEALRGIKAILKESPLASYPIPTNECMEGLITKLNNFRPPIGHTIAKDSLPKSVDVDFRHIIYAGWIATQPDNHMSFGLINQLCEHAIMQQLAIRLSLKTDRK